MLERCGDGGSCSFGCDPPSPERLPERPCDLDLVAELRHVVGVGGANPADGVSAGLVLDQPETEAVRLPVLQVVAEAPGSMLAVERRARTKRTPDIWIGPHGEERILVATTKTSEREPGGVDGARIGHRRELSAAPPCYPHSTPQAG